MDNQNLVNLQKIAKIFQPQNIITSEEIDQVLKGIMEILATYKKDTTTINEETKQVVNILLEQVIQSNKQALEGSKLIVDERSNELEALLKDVKQMISDVEILASSVEDGKDADEEKIVEDVISRIKIDPTVVTVSAQEIKDKLASLEGDNKLDISSIKGFDLYSTKVDLDYAVKTLQHQTSTLLNRSSVRSIVAGTNITVDNTDPSNPVISSTGSGGSIAIGDSITDAQAGSILFAGASGVLAQDNASLFFDDTKKRLGLLTSAPTHSLTLDSHSTGIALYNTADKTTNYERLVTSVSTNIFNILTQYGGSAASRQLNIGLAGTAGNSTPSRYLGIGGGSATVGRFAFYDTTSSAQAFISTNLSNSASSGQSTTVLINPTFTQTGTASYTALLVNPAEITLGNGSKLLADFQVGGSSKFSVDNTGKIVSAVNTIQLSSASIVRSGAHALTLTTAGTTNATYPTGTITLVDLAATQTLTNKTISGASNTITNIPVSAITFIGCKLTKSAAQSLGNNTYTAISFDGETYDTDTMHDNATNNTRITFTTAGKYMIFASGPYITNNSALATKITLNATTTLVEEIRNNTGAGNETIVLAVPYQATAGDYVEFYGKAISGNYNANTTCSFSAYRIG